MNNVRKHLGEEDVIIPKSFGAGAAIFSDSEGALIQMVDQRGDPWTIIMDPVDAFRLGHMLLSTYAELNGIDDMPTPPTEEDYRRLMGLDDAPQP